MAKPISTFLHAVSRVVKAAVGVLLIPPVIGLLGGVRAQLQAVPVGSKTFFDWAVAGLSGYVTLHLLLYQPAGLFRVQHRLLSGLALWLFGGQVSTTGDKGARKKNKDDSVGAPHGSTLVVVSPYVVPLYPILVCAGAWALKRWLPAPAGTLGGPGDPSLVEAPAAVLVGATLAMHWVMTADALQGGGRTGARGRLPFDTHLIALGMIGVISLLALGAALPMAVDGVSLPAILSDALSRAGAIYAAVIQHLFF